MAASEAQDETGPAFQTVAVGGLFILGVLFALYAASTVLVPIAVSLLLDFLLSPIIRWFGRHRIKAPIAAAIVMFGALGVIGGTSWMLAGPAAEWVQRAPSTMAQVQNKITHLVKPIQRLQAAAGRMEQAATSGGASAGPAQSAGPTLASNVLGGMAAFVGAATTVFFLTYFLLASGDLFLRKLLSILPGRRDRAKAIAITSEIESHVSRYLAITMLVNVGLGLATWGVLAALDMPNAALWGAVAGVLNLVPYLGAVLTAVIIAAAALVSYPSVGAALIPPTAFFALNMIESNVVTPALMGRHFPLNAVVVFGGLLVWGFLWGITGAILAVPLMVTIKVICDHVESLQSVGAFLDD